VALPQLLAVIPSRDNVTQGLRLQPREKLPATSEDSLGAIGSAGSVAGSGLPHVAACRVGAAPPLFDAAAEVDCGGVGGVSFVPL